MNPSIKMEVGIEDCLHIEFEYNKSKYGILRPSPRLHARVNTLGLDCFEVLNAGGWPVLARYHLKDVVTGKIYFLLVRIRIKHMELAIIRRESAGTGASNLRCTLHTGDVVLDAGGAARPSSLLDCVVGMQCAEASRCTSLFVCCFARQPPTCTTRQTR